MLTLLVYFLSCAALTGACIDGAFRPAIKGPNYLMALCNLPRVAVSVPNVSLVRNGNRRKRGGRVMKTQCVSLLNPAGRHDDRKIRVQRIKLTGLKLLQCDAAVEGSGDKQIAKCDRRRLRLAQFLARLEK